jgi:hypothetical protein
VFKIKLKRADGLISIFQINEFGNMTGLNDLTLTGKINISSYVSHQYTNGSYVIAKNKVVIFKSNITVIV